MGSPREGLEVTRPLSAPPPNFPGDEEFQSIDQPTRYHNSRRHSQSHPGDAPPNANTTQGEVGDIRLCEEMAAEISERRASHSQRNANLLHSTFEALESNIDDEGVDFLSNLKFEGN